MIESGSQICVKIIKCDRGTQRCTDTVDTRHVEDRQPRKSGKNQQLLNVTNGRLCMHPYTRTKSHHIKYLPRWPDVCTASCDLKATRGRRRRKKNGTCRKVEKDYYECQRAIIHAALSAWHYKNTECLGASAVTDQLPMTRDFSAAGKILWRPISKAVEVGKSIRC